MECALLVEDTYISFTEKNLSDNAGQCGDIYLVRAETLVVTHEGIGG